MRGSKWWLLLISGLCWAGLPAAGWGASLGVYQFTGADPAGDLDTPNANGTANAGLTYTQFSRVNVNTVSTLDAFNSDQWNTTATIDLTEYISFSLTVGTGFTGTLESLRFKCRGSATVADEFRVAVSTNGFATSEYANYTVPYPNLTEFTFDFADIALSAGGTVEFRFYVFGDTQADGVGTPSSAGTFRVDDVEPLGTMPFVVIDFPTEGEVIVSPTYTMRLGANASTNNVRVKIDTGDWSQCRFDVGYWWFDWAFYPQGPHTILAEAWDVQGNRYETGERHCTYRPSAAYGDIEDAYCTLETAGDAQKIDGSIYINTNGTGGVTFRFDAEVSTYHPAAQAWLQWSPVDGEGNWYDINTNAIPLNTNGVTSNGVLVEGTLTLKDFEIAQRYEFVIRYETGARATIWLRPFAHSISGAGVAFYDLAPDGDHPTSSDTYNGAFIPLQIPQVLIDFPQEGEIITSPTYAIRSGANSSTNNVRVKIDTGDWSPCYYATGYWWFDWSSYSVGPHEIKAEAWNILGQRYETAVRHCIYDPYAPYGHLVDAWAELETSGRAGIDGGNIYTNPDNLVFRFLADATQFDPAATALLHVTSNGWVDVDHLVIPIDTNGVTSNGVLIEGQVALTEVDIMVRHEFVVEFQDGSRTTVWLKPFAYAATGPSEIQYDLAPDGMHPNAGDTYNGFFTPLETPFVVIDFPYEGEVLPGAVYEIRCGANSSTNNVQVKIDTGDWSPCYFSVGYWWFHWTNYPIGCHELIAEAWNVLGQRYETPIRNCVYPPQWNMDGALDANATMVSSNGGLHLYAGLIGEELYVAVEDAGEGNDHFIFLANPPGALVNAPWAKAGQVAQWAAYLADENDNDFEGWFDVTSNGAVAAASGNGHLEGTINLRVEFGAMPSQVYLAMAPYENWDGGVMVHEFQVPPTVNSDGNIDASEYVLVDLAAVTVNIWELADLNKDCVVDLEDHAALVGCMNGPGQPPAGTCAAGVDADLDNDGDVDLKDWAVFSKAYAE